MDPSTERKLNNKFCVNARTTGAQMKIYLKSLRTYFGFIVNANYTPE